MDWKTFLRQLFLCSGPWALYFMHGVCVGLPTVLVPQLRRANWTITIEQASWLPSLHVYCGIPWVIMLSVLIIVIGRKKSHIIVCISTFLGFIIFYFSTSINHFFVGSIFLGALTSSSLTTSIVMLTECISAKHRGMFLVFRSGTYSVGVLTANAIGTFYHWQNIVTLGLVCTLYTLFNVTLWPESPLWLATKGRIVECSAAHRWLKGDDEESEKELAKLLKTHGSRKVVKQNWSVQYLSTALYRKQFLKPILLSSLLSCIHCFSGKIMFSVYAIDVLKSISSNESTSYSGMLILDIVTVTSMYLACVLSKFLKRRTILIGFSIVCINIMIIISIYLYLAKLSVIEENKYLSLILLATYSITASCGPLIMSTTIIGELLPLKSRILSLCIIALIYKAVHGTFIKIAPFCFKSLGIHGTFALCAILSIIFLFIIYFSVPETKNKTIQEISDLLNNQKILKVDESHELMNV